MRIPQTNNPIYYHNKILYASPATKQDGSHSYLHPPRCGSSYRNLLRCSRGRKVPSSPFFRNRRPWRRAWPQTNLLWSAGCPGHLLLLYLWLLGLLHLRLDLRWTCRMRRLSSTKTAFRSFSSARQVRPATAPIFYGLQNGRWIYTGNARCDLRSYWGFLEGKRAVTWDFEAILYQLYQSFKFYVTD